MQDKTKPASETDHGHVALKAERESYLLEVIQTARTEMAPRNFAERHLVDEMAIAKWRGIRTTLMEGAVYDRQDASPRPGLDEHPDRPSSRFNQHVFHVAAAHSESPHATILAALTRLDAQFHRQFCSAPRHFQALRRQNPFAPTVPIEPDELETQENDTEENEPTKEEPQCTPSH